VLFISDNREMTKAVVDTRSVAVASVQEAVVYVQCYYLLVGVSYQRTENTIDIAQYITNSGYFWINRQKW
jgi:hypothetical protein